MCLKGFRTSRERDTVIRVFYIEHVEGKYRGSASEGHGSNILLRYVVNHEAKLQYVLD